MPKEGVGAPGANRERAGGKVSLGHEARLRLELVQLGSITQLHTVIEDRDVRLDLVAGSLSPLSGWTPQAREVLMWACPPWVMQRGKAGARHHLLICGGQFLPSQSLLLPADSLVPVMLVDTKFQAPRLLQLAAAHAAAVAEAVLERSGPAGPVRLHMPVPISGRRWCALGSVAASAVMRRRLQG